MKIHAWNLDNAEVKRQILSKYLDTLFILMPTESNLGDHTHFYDLLWQIQFPVHGHGTWPGLGSAMHRRHHLGLQMFNLLRILVLKRIFVNSKHTNNKCITRTSKKDYKWTHFIEMTWRIYFHLTCVWYTNIKPTPTKADQLFYWFW